MNTLARFVAALCALLLVASLSAQLAPASKSLTDALKLRGDMAEAVGMGSEKSDKAIARLKAETSPTGLKIDRDADFAFAAIDIGQRLVAAGKPGEAEVFFIEAEKSLEIAIKKTPDTAAREKAEFLEQRAFIRANYLNKAPGADADLSQAITLQPEEKRLQQKRDQLPAEKTGRSKEQSK